MTEYELVVNGVPVPVRDLDVNTYRHASGEDRVEVDARDCRVSDVKLGRLVRALAEDGESDD